jgi:hypothetical protein
MTSQKKLASSGFRIVIGSEEDGRRMLGSRNGPWIAEMAVNTAMVQYYCSAVEDGNASYWDANFAQTHWGEIISPPAMLSAWTIPLGWRPSGQRFHRKRVFFADQGRGQAELLRGTHCYLRPQE